MLVLTVLGYVFMYILLILLAALLAILLIPFKYHFTGEKMEKEWFKASAAWLFGGVKFNIYYNSGKLSSNIRILGIHKRIEKDGSNKNSTGENKDKEQKNNKKPKSKNPYSYLTYEVMEKGFQCTVKLLNHCKPRRFVLKAKAGFEDPMYTGLLCGIQGVWSAILDKYDIHLQPDFEEDEIRGSLRIGGSIRLFYLLLVAMEFILTRPVRSIWLKNLNIKIKRRLKTWQTLILKRT